MAWDHDRPATEISYPPYSPSPSELEAHHNKNARIQEWTKALPEPHAGSGASVGAHSAQWSDRAPSNVSGPSASRDPRYAHPFASAGPGVRPPHPQAPSQPHPQLEIHRRPPRGTPVAPLLAQSPSHDYAADYELPRADHLVNPVHGGAPGGPGSMRSRREAYFAAALDLPLDMITEALPNNLERELHMYQHPQMWEAPPSQQQPHPNDEKRGGFRSLLGRSKSQVSLKHSGPPSSSSSERSARGISLDPSAAAGTAGTLSKMRSMDAKLLQRASMSGSMNPVTGNEAQGMQEGAWRNTHALVPPGPGVPTRNGSLARSKSQIHPAQAAHAGPSAPPVSFRNGHAASAENVEPVVKLARRTSSRGALGKPVRGPSRTPSPHQPDAATQQAATTVQVPPAAAPGVLTNNNGPRANGNAIAAIETRTSDRTKENAPVKETHIREARAPVLPSSKAAPIKPSQAQTRAAKAPPALPTVVVTTAPDEGSKRVKASVTKESKANMSASTGLPKRTSSISRAQKPSRSTSSPSLATASLPSAPTPATHPAHPVPQSKSQPPSPSQASVHSPGPARKKSVPAPNKENKRFEPVGEASKRQSKSRVFSWLPSRKAAEGKENKAKAPTSQSSHRKDVLGQSQPAVVAANAGAAAAQPAQQSASQPVLHGQSKQPSNLSHHQSPAPALETHVHHAETMVQPPLAAESEQPFHPSAPAQPEQHYAQQQHLRVAPSGYEWLPQQQSPMANQLPPGAMPMAPGLVPQQTQYGVQAGYPTQPDPCAYAGQPLPEIPTHPRAMGPTTAAHPAIPQATGAVPPPAAEAARRWLPPMFNGPSAERGDERQKRMSTHEDNTNLKKQVSSTGTATEDANMYRTDPNSVVSMSSVSGNISHSASLAADDMKLNTLDLSTLETRLGATANATSPISPLDPQGISTPATTDPVTPPRSATQITLGSGFTPLKVSDLFGGAGSNSESESDGTPTKRSASGKSFESNAALSGGRTESAGVSSAAPNDDTQKNACAPGTPSRGASSPNSSSATGETGATAALTPSKFDLRGKSWSETERSCHESTPSVSEPIAIELPTLPPRPPPPPSKPLPPAPEEFDIPDIGPDWLELGPEYGLEGQVYLHHCGSLRVLERVVEEDEETPLPKSELVAPRVVWQADPTTPPPPQRTGRPRRGSGSAQRSPRSGEKHMLRVLLTQAGVEHPFDSLPDMDEILERARVAAEVGAQRPPAVATEAQAVPPNPCSDEAVGGVAVLGPAAVIVSSNARAPGSDSSSGNDDEGAQTGTARSTRSAPLLPPVVVLSAEGEADGGAPGQTTPTST